MSDKRFIVETVEITDCDTDVSRIAKVITDKEEIYSYDDLYEIVDLLNELSDENRQLKEENEELQEGNKNIVTLLSIFVQQSEKLGMENQQLKSYKKWTEEQIQKKLLITVTPTLYGWKSKVEELDE